MLNIKLEQFRVFVAVADCGAITEAASLIGRTPAAVSMTLSQIEHQLGGALFQGERKSKLTRLGEYTLQLARRAVEEHQRALNEIDRFASGTEGLSRIAVVPSVATRLLPAAIKGLSQEFPGIHIDIRDIDSAAIQEAIMNGTVDFGIASKPDDKNLQADYLLSDPFRLICRNDNPLVDLKRDIEWRDLKDENFIVNGLCEAIDNAGLHDLITRSTLYMHNTLSILAFIEDGFGISLLPSLIQPSSADLSALPLAQLDVTRDLYILTRKGGSLSPLDHRLIEVIREQAAGFIQ
ncbi:MAG: LysR family transcriptional regulator [Pseudomonadota bacterium]